MKKRYEIWATFEDGIEAKVEEHKTVKEAEAAIRIMNRQNEYELKIGYGFPHGVPVYEIR